MLFRSLSGILACTLAVWSCQPEGPAQAPPASSYTFPYSLDRPDTVFELPDALREISGLSLSPDGEQLLAVNDEKGVVYFLNPATGAVNRTLDFGKNADYEGVEAVGTDIFVVKSNGTLYQIPDSGKTKDYPTPLYNAYDVEGLTYDPAQHRLLLACKGKAGKADSLRHKKAVYAYNLKKHRLEENPAFLIDRTEIARWKGQSDGVMAQLYEFFEADDAPSAFGPSGLAVCPRDSHLYVVASVGKALAVLTPGGTIVALQKLPAGRFNQPEGICFDRQNRLYISTEGGKGRNGRIYRFSPSLPE